MFDTQRDLVVYCHHALMDAGAYMSAATACAYALVQAVQAYAWEHEIDNLLVDYA